MFNMELTSRASLLATSGNHCGPAVIVLAEILRVFPHTLLLALGAVVLAILIGIPLGMISAVKNNTSIDHVSRFLRFGNFHASFWLALVLLLFFSVYTGWFPLVGAGEWDNPTSVLHHLFLPALALAARGRSRNFTVNSFRGSRNFCAKIISLQREPKA
jgi:ABC-type dipeptide/oligopeptide/nickel transport system permease component